VKTIACLLFVCTLTSVAFAQKDGETPYFAKNFKVSEIDRLKVQTSSGSINVKGGATDEARIEMYVQANNWNGKSNLSTEEIEERLKDYNIAVRRVGTEIQAIVERKNKNWNDWKRQLSISFKIYVPEKITTHLTTSGGGITLANLSGKQDFKTSGGGLNLQNIGGNVRGRTSGGSIKLSGGKDNIDLQTSGGGISVEDAQGTITLITSGGGIQLRNMSGKIMAETSGGGVKADHIKGELKTETSGGSITLYDIDGSLDASTSGGGIDAEITGLGNYLKLHSSAGSIRVKMPMNKGMNLDLDGDRVQVGNLAKFDGTLERDHVKGTLNGGGISVKMDASAGGIYINK